MRKKKLRLLAVLLAASMLCSCSAPVYPRSTDEPQLQFYYCTGEGADTGIGALAARPCLCRTNARTLCCSNI